jgi:hypothetical protein
MSEDKTIDQKATLWNNKVLLSSFAVLILGTNAFNAYIHQQDTNTVTIEKNAEIAFIRAKYDKDRSDKKDQRVLEQAKEFVVMEGKNRDIKILEKELEYCNKRK